jgi:hypothetical protein
MKISFALLSFAKADVCGDCDGEFLNFQYILKLLIFLSLRLIDFWLSICKFFTYHDGRKENILLNVSSHENL